MKVASHSSSAQYVLKHHADGSFSCSCPAWRNQGGAPPDARTCKHLREAVGDAHEDARLRARGADPEKPVSRKPAGSSSSAGGGSKAKKKAPALLLANTYDGADPAGFHLSEKLDGVRAFWDPAARLLLSRLGNPFPAPAWFLDALPADRSLDGELFLGRGMFSRTVSAVKTAGGAWEGVEYRLFDVPSEGAKPFEERMEVLKGIVKAASGSRAKLVFVEQTPCTSREHLDAELARVLRLGGEGLMLRKPGSKYEGRRSATLLKLKKFYDAEAKVVGYQPGKGKYKGMTGSLEAEMECGKRFFVGSGMSDAERKSPPKIGTIISYAFQELTDDGVPRFPTYRGVALDKKKAKDAVVRTVSKADDDESLEDEQ
ncbi:hypothetical protein DFJ74DRAFT_759691 [Hyaloraphidium curvatum]|nr:hypothetical protein DFJ74DRAFT_759691 [Hyaloraphidium curvatum]